MQIRQVKTGNLICICIEQKSFCGLVLSTLYPHRGNSMLSSRYLFRLLWSRCCRRQQTTINLLHVCMEETLHFVISTGRLLFFCLFNRMLVSLLRWHSCCKSTRTVSVICFTYVCSRYLLRIVVVLYRKDVYLFCMYMGETASRNRDLRDFLFTLYVHGENGA